MKIYYSTFCNPGNKINIIKKTQKICAKNIITEINLANNSNANCLKLLCKNI